MFYELSPSQALGLLTPTAKPSLLPRWPASEKLRVVVVVYSLSGIFAAIPVDECSLQLLWEAYERRPHQRRPLVFTVSRGVAAALAAEARAAVFAGN